MAKHVYRRPPSRPPRRPKYIGETLAQAIAGTLTSAGALSRQAQKPLAGSLWDMLFNIGHETGDLSEYDSTVTDGGDLSVTTAAALAGSKYGMQCVIDDTTAIYGRKNQTAPASNEIRYRFYVDPNGLTMGAADDFVIFQHILSGDPWNINVAHLDISGGTYQLGFAFYDDSGWQSYTTHNITDAPHYVEIHIERASSDVASDGRHRWWIDGVLVRTQNNVDNYDAFALLSYINFGATAAIDAGTSGTFYLDELKANDDGSEIGPVTGHLVRQAQKVVAGALTSAGALIAQGQKALAGTLTSAGALVRQGQKTLSGTLTSAGTLVKQARTSVSGTLTSAGTVKKRTATSLAGALTSAGALVKQAQIGLTGTITSAGDLAAQGRKVLAGTLTSAGAVAKKTATSLAGTLTSSGTVATVSTFLKSLAGTLASAGTLTAQGQKVLSGALTSAGALTARAQKLLAGTLASSGTVKKHIARALSGVLSFIGGLIAGLTGVVVEEVEFTLYIDQARDQTQYIDQAHDQELEL